MLLWFFSYVVGKDGCMDMCMDVHTCLVGINDIQQSNCGASYPHAVCVKGVPHNREAEGSFSNSHLWKQEKWELADKRQPPPRGVLSCSAQWSWSQNQKKEISITRFRSPHLSQNWSFWGADVRQMEGTKPSLCLHPALNSYLPFCDDISQEDGTARSFLNLNRPFCLCERVSSPLEREKQTEECKGVPLPVPSLGGGWRGQAKPRSIVQPHTTPPSSSTWRLGQGFKYCITAFGREYLLKIPEKLLAREFADKSKMKN